MRRLLGLCLVAIFAASPLALNTAQALAEHVRCGDTIYQDTTLDSDVLECPERAITIGEDNVTLNLNGHTIAGSFSGSYWGVGVFNHGHSGVTIENGVIRDLGGGIVADGATNNTFRRLSISRTGSWGIRMFDSDGNVIARNTLTDNGGNSSSPVTGGIDVRGSRNEVSENRLSRNVDVGIGVYGNDNTVDRNAVSETDYPVSLGGARARVRRNFLFSNLYSIWLRDAHENRIEKNRLRHDTFGIKLEYSDDNQIVDNSIRDLESFGVRLTASNRNLVARNAVSPDAAEDGIGSGGQDNQIIGNRVWVRRGLGIGLYTQDRRGIVEGNFVSSTDGTAGYISGVPPRARSPATSFPTACRGSSCTGKRRRGARQHGAQLRSRRHLGGGSEQPGPGREQYGHAERRRRHRCRRPRHHPYREQGEPERRSRDRSRRKCDRRRRQPCLPQRQPAAMSQRRL